MNYYLIYPMAFYVFYMGFFSLIMFLSRVNSIRTGTVSPKYFKTYTGDLPPDRVLLLGRHYDNQFQLPILFLITCLVQLNLGFVSELSIGFAWVFVLTRLLHAWSHLGKNFLPMRAAFFAVGLVMIMAMWVQIVIGAVRA